MAQADDLARFVRDRLAAVSNAEDAAQMQRYLKTDMPMFGVRQPVQKPIQREAVHTFVPADSEAWVANVRALWAGPERELKYAAIAYAKAFKRRRFLDLAAVPLLEQLVRGGAWWDLVDDIAANCVGEVVRRHRAEMRPILDAWITDDDVWIRRTAILAQLKHKADTDVDQLFGYIRRQAPDTTFWIRKAIGWSLREFAKTDPDEVIAFLRAERQALSGLSFREASKHLKV